MPRFYFPIFDNEREIADPEGVELPDLATAVSEARRSALDTFNDALATGKNIGHQVIQIHDGEGQVLAKVRFDEVIESEGDE